MLFAFLDILYCYEPYVIVYDITFTIGIAAMIDIAGGIPIDAPINIQFIIQGKDILIQPLLQCLGGLLLGYLRSYVFDDTFLLTDFGACVATVSVDARFLYLHERVIIVFDFWHGV